MGLTKSPTQRISGTLSPAVNRQEREGDQSYAFCAEF
jgi:hypothetical protein